MDETTAATSRVRWNLAGTPSVIAGSIFDIEPGVGYEVSMGIGPLGSYTMRFTGYVSGKTLFPDLTKVGAQSLRWLGYSLPRDITLSQLGLQDVLVPWNFLSRVRLLPPGSSSWINYQYNTLGGYWYLSTAPGVPNDPAITAGMGVVFIRGGPAGVNTLPQTPWYFHPPNAW